MKRFALRWSLLFCLLVSAAPSLSAQLFEEPPPAPGVMRISPDLAEIVRMVKEGVPQDQILEVIKLQPRLYSLTKTDLANLKKLGINSTLISAMRAHDKALLRLWKKGAVSAAATNNIRESLPIVLPPKLLGGNPATDLGTPMRDADTPVIWVTPPQAPAEEPSGAYTRPWTSSIIVEEPPPPSKLEIAPTAPGPDYVWVPGNWAWQNGGWVWESGRWLHRPAGAVWMNGSWQPHARGWIWIPGRWR